MSHSFKSLRASGVISRADLLRADWSDIHIEPNFNKRFDTEELQQSIIDLADYMETGGEFPPLELRVSDDGRLFIVEGHRRHAAIALVIQRKLDAGDEKAAIQWRKVYFLPFSGNRVHQLSRIITSQSQRPLTTLELAMGYKALSDEGLTSAEIAVEVHHTRPHVDQLLLLANAEPDVHELVQSGRVPATTAIDVVRKHGAEAGKFLQAKLDRSGKSKLTESDVKGKSLPSKVTSKLVGSVDAFTAALPKDTRRVLASMDGTHLDVDRNVTISAKALFDLVQAQFEVQEARTRQEERARNKAAKNSQRDIEDEE